MPKYVIAFPSITYALKAQRLLNSNGYYCEVQRTPKELALGCGYSIIVEGDINDIKENLIKHKIPYNGMLESTVQK